MPEDLRRGTPSPRGHPHCSHETQAREHMLSHLSVQRDGTGLALGTDAVGPWEVSLTPRLDLAADVLQGNKLPPEGQRLS